MMDSRYAELSFWVVAICLFGIAMLVVAFVL